MANFTTSLLISSKGDSTQSVYSQDDVMGFSHVGHWGQGTVNGKYMVKMTSWVFPT